MSPQKATKWTTWFIWFYTASGLLGIVLLLSAKQPIPLDFRLFMVFLMFVFSLLLRYKESKVAAWGIVVLAAYDLMYRSFGVFAYLSLAKVKSAIILSGPIFWIVFDVALLIFSMFVLKGFIKKGHADAKR